MTVKALPSAELSASDSRGGSLRVSFFQTGDRYTHAIDLVDGNHTRRLLESVEGNDEDAWPPSPPMQHLNVSWLVSGSEQRHVAMLVGGAGSSHWSMCVAVSDWKSRPREKAERVLSDTDGWLFENANLSNTELVFEVACRIQKPPQWLGTTYRVLAAPVAVSEKLNCACIPVSPPRGLMTTHGVELHMDTTREPLPLLRLRATDPNALALDLPTTVRWRYTLRFLGSAVDDVDQIVLGSH